MRGRGRAGDGGLLDRAGRRKGRRKGPRRSRCRGPLPASAALWRRRRRGCCRRRCRGRDGGRRCGGASVNICVRAHGYADIHTLEFTYSELQSCACTGTYTSTNMFADAAEASSLSALRWLARRSPSLAWSVLRFWTGGWTTERCMRHKAGVVSSA